MLSTGSSRRGRSDLVVAADHDLLLSAISSRLRAGVDGQPWAQAELLAVAHDCAHALDQLRPVLLQERDRAASAERELQALRCALAALRNGLTGTQDVALRAPLPDNPAS